MLHALRFFGLLVLNIFVAVIGTAILDTALSKAIPSTSISAVLWKEIALSVVCATLIGFGMWRTWRNEAAKWTWVIPSLWFAWGVIAITGHGIWGPLSLGSASTDGTAEMRSFFVFTIPLVRAVAYSIGAYLSSLVYRRPVTLIQGLDDKKPFPAIELVNPMWSNLPPEVLGRTFSGVANAYAIELILGKDKLEGDQEDARFLIDPRECVYVYGLLKRNDSVLKSQDLVSLKRRYQVWWNDHKQLPLVELRKQWADNNRPLTGSDFRWL